MSERDARLRWDDARARLAAQTVFDRPVVLAAGAGTGKTAALVARICAWGLGPGWQRTAARLREEGGVATAASGRRESATIEDEVAAALLDRVVAITFTEAAAAEMARRIGEALARLAAGELPIGIAAGALPGGGEAEGAAEPAAGGATAVEPASEPASEPAPEQADRSTDGEPPVSPLAARRARRLLAHLDRLRVGTIHAFCRRLLADHPLEARVHPGFTVDAEGELVDEVAREVLDEGLRRAYGEPPAGDAAAGDDGEPAADRAPDGLQLAAVGIGPAELLEALRLLLTEGVPAAVLEADPAAPERVAPLARAVAAAGEALLAAGGPLAAAGGKLAKPAELLAAVGRVVAAAKAAGEGDRSDGVERLAAEARQLCDAGLDERLKDWRKGNFKKTATALLGDREDALQRAAADLLPLVCHTAALEPRLLAAALRLLAPLVAEGRERLRRRGVATFHDLLAGADRLLAEHPAVLAAERRRIDQLLVDELQDTDPLQCRLVRRLALTGPAERRPGLFLVGDAKQSIYGWRNADLAAYEGLVDEALAAGGHRATLSISFRSVPAVLAEVERLTAPVMEAVAGLQPAFEPLLASEERAAAEPFAVAGCRPVEHWLPCPGSLAAQDAPGSPGRRRLTSGEALGLEAAALAGELAALAGEGVAWGDMAVLLRSTSAQETVLAALKEAGVPYTVAQDRSYYRRREVLEAKMLAAAVLDPADHLGLVTCLRAAWVGVPDAALPALWQGGLPRLMTELGAAGGAAGQAAGGAGEAGDAGEAGVAAIERLARSVEDRLAAQAAAIPGLAGLAGWHRSLAAFAAVVRRLRWAFEHRPADRFVAALRRLTLIEATEAARFLGPWRAANLDRFFRRLAATLDGGAGGSGAGADAALRFLRRAIEEEREVEEAQPRLVAAGGAVQVMTVHAAKGLGFRHVYLLQLHRQPGRPPGTRRCLVHRLPEPAGDAASGADAVTDTGGERWELTLFDWPTAGAWQADERQRLVERAEQVRLLYVAATRAADRLVLSGLPEGRTTPWRDARSLGALLPSRDGWPSELADWIDRGLPGTGEPKVGGEEATVDRDGVRWRLLRPAAGGPEEAPVADPPVADPPGADPSTADPSTAGAPPESEGGSTGPRLPTAAEAAAQLAAERQRRRRAAAHMARPWSGRASDEAHRLPAADAGEDEAAPVAPPPAAPTPADPTPASEVAAAASEAVDPAADSSARRLAMAVGSAVHRLLEDFDLAADPEAELERQRRRLPELLARLLEIAPAEDPPAAAVAQADELVDRFHQGPLWQRWLDVRSRVIARELPLLAPAAGEDGPTASEEGPVAVIEGVADLVYRLPEDEGGGLAVVDYKTDRLADDRALERRAATYLRQGAVYQQALAAALDLPRAPRFELWFLAAGRVVTGADHAGTDPTPSGATNPQDPPEQLNLF